MTVRRVVWVNTHALLEIALGALQILGSVRELASSSSSSSSCANSQSSLGKKGDMDLKIHNPSGIRILKLILFGRWRNQSPERFCPRRNHRYLQYEWERSAEAHDLVTTWSKFQPPNTALASCPVELCTAVTERPYFKVPQQAVFPVKWKWPSSHWAVTNIH